jgi:hypothetical protein
MLTTVNVVAFVLFLVVLLFPVICECSRCSIDAFVYYDSYYVVYGYEPIELSFELKRVNVDNSHRHDL